MKSSFGLIENRATRLARGAGFTGKGIRPASSRGREARCWILCLLTRQVWHIVIYLFLVCGLPSLLQGQVVINELLADNAAAVDNGDDYPDYIELYNRSTNRVDLLRWRLTDDLANPAKFIFPSNTFIGPNGYLLVWADDKTNSPGMHIGFGLNNKGENLYLLSAAGFLADAVSFGLQLTDFSIGRVPEGTGAWVLNVPTPMGSNQVQTVAEPVRLFFNEWAALNTNTAGQVQDDWLEIYNATNRPVALGGILISDASTNHPIPALSFIEANGFLQLLADDSADKGADHLPFKLSSTSGETLTLTRPDRVTIINQVTFGPQQGNVSEGRLPDAAPAPYRHFPGNQRTPGKSNFLLITNVVVNEVLPHTDPPLEDAIELHNPSNSDVDISYWWLSDDRDDPFKFRIPPGTIIRAGGFKVFYEYQGEPGGFNPNGLGISPSFTLNSFLGDEVNLFIADASTNLTGFRLHQAFGPSLNGVSFGRYVTTYDTNFVPMSQRTFGQDNPLSLAQFRQGTGRTNALPDIPPIVISEIMYHPPDIVQGTNILDNSDDEFIELHNRTDQSQTLYYNDPNFPDPDYRTNTWHIRNAVSFNFPRGVVLPPRGFLLLVNFDPETNTTLLASFLGKYKVPPGTPMFGPYGGKLGNGGETLELKEPDKPEITGPDVGLVPYVDVERIQYNDKFPWPTAPDGSGASLQRIDVAAFGNDAQNWGAGLPSPGSIYVANHPPELASIPDIVTNEFRRIWVTNVASDIDIPAQNLTFSLDPGAPPEATISTNGVFYWWPMEADGPGEYDITVRVTDDGNPSMNGSQTFKITVGEVNRQPLTYVRDQYTKPGQTLAFPTAHDTDIPANPLVYTLLSSAPAGLELNPTTGIVTWTPTLGQANSVHQITVRVVDNGAPSLSNQRTYTIYVLDPAAVIIIPDVSRTVEGVRITWEATVGKTYAVEYTDSLNKPSLWTDLGPPVQATTTTMEATDRPTDPRFYRVRQLD
jgi:hypothetical protein